MKTLATTQNTKNVLLATAHPTGGGVLAFTNTTYTKQSALALAQWHQDQDRFVLGTYGEALHEGWKGCSLRCMAKVKHLNYPLLFGIDARIAYVSGKLFENIIDYKDWTVKLFTSVAEGSDTALAFNRFMYWLITDKQHGLIRFNDSKAISNVGDLYAKVIRGETVTKEQWLAAAYAAANAASATANSTAYAANATAYAASAAANAASATAYADPYAANATAYAANATAYAANATAYAANATAYAANAAKAIRQQYFETMADKLCFYLSGQVD